MKKTRVCQTTGRPIKLRVTRSSLKTGSNRNSERHVESEITYKINVTKLRINLMNKAKRYEFVINVIRHRL